MGNTKEPVRRSVRVWVSLIALMLGSLSLWAADPEIACRELLRQRTTVTVMGSDGSDPTIIFENDKFTKGSTSPSWSPGGEWIAFLRVTNPHDSQVEGIYKIRPNGEEPTQILCAAGTGRDNVPFNYADSPKWSPDGQWILLHLWYGDWGDGNWLGIVSKNGEPGAFCHSDLIYLYSPSPWDPQSATGWVLGGGTPWNHDGSKIAFFETYLENDIPIENRLKVLDIEVLADTPTVTGTHAIALPPGLRDLEPGGDTDWQRDGGTILIFDTNDGLGWLDLDLDNELIRAWGHLTDGWSANWSPNNDRIVYNLDLELRVANIGYGAGGVPTCLDSTVIYPDRQVGCLWPDWKRDPFTCSVDADCDDGNPCTYNICDAPSGTCIYPPNYGPCDDGNSCTTDDFCDENGACSGTTVADGASCGTGSYCCSGQCAAPECVSDTDCDDDEFCTLDSCVDLQDPCAANCQYAPNPDPSCACLPKGEPCSSDDECCSGSCHPIKGTCK